MASSPQAELLQLAITSSIPDPPATFNGVPSEHVYVPPGHLRALDPDAMLVIGSRGAGKSFWWFALQDDQRRLEILKRETEVTLGFGQSPERSYPDRDELMQLLRLGVTPRIIWRTVVAQQLAPTVTVGASWRERATWVTDHPSEVAEHFRTHDEKLASAGKTHLVLFDALDRTADARDDREKLLSGLLQLVLELRSFKGIRAKVFARHDMLELPAVRAFPDASKVLASGVNLAWSTHDLYGLLFQYLGNAEDGNLHVRSDALLYPGALRPVRASGRYPMPCA